VPEPFLAATIRWGSAGSLLVTSLAIMGSPGPATISLTAAGSAYGIRRSLGYLVGIVVGTTLVLVAVATGITAALLVVPGLRIGFVVVSAAYILWLAYRVATAPPLGTEAPVGEVPSVAGGTLLGVANPKAWIAIAAVYAGAHLADGAATDAAVKVAILTAMIVLICTTWLIAGASLARVLRDPSRARVVNVVLAVALVGATLVAVVR
jgi:threonine/homoserine/homoserine lactone efflux protein